MKLLAITQQFAIRISFPSEYSLCNPLCKSKKGFIHNAVLYTLSQKSPLYRRNHSFVVNLGLLNLWKFKFVSDEQQHKHVLLYILLSFDRRRVDFYRRDFFLGQLSQNISARIIHDVDFRLTTRIKLSLATWHLRRHKPKSLIILSF